ncbi:acetyl/propionyl/methylcrotonyl-CoA carboxylase subunit alpha [Nocardioides insulae]|uniref:acetyl/propionyl/methylcrotonyl-CoA carboxylase subunit alpha n=1 Tax=Nocardioides insulae TaxID=394734 RepID=UPI000426EC9A|nr:biotin carboxylase N-terminal domain-containing protein [Nocardioides insulae]
MKLSTLLIANRGEIALRVIRTAHRLGLSTVAVHTDIDARAPHVRAADRAIRIGSYLDIDEVVAAAAEADADAVHPGYGFLSERAAFAEALTRAGITLVGPSASVMDRMGRKDAARRIAADAGVPVVPSWEPETDGDPAVPADAFPVLVKAAAGGGGKGMRVVRAAEDLPEAMAAARREAASAFGDDTMLVEKYVEHGRHLEVQVMADAHGNVLHLWERDCSPQRRHQKVLEEAPAPTIDEQTRRRLTGAAVDLARSVGYLGAGTVEFLLDTATGDFYFLEMNTRLQVEHPVTEAITGLDLVELQLLVADGQPLPIGQAEVRREGHAIEARVYAEDAFGGFLPQAGHASYVSWPTTDTDLVRIGARVRVDHALESGQVVSTSYDPMLGKVIVHAPDRESARIGLVAALEDTAIHGLTTNTGFLRALVASTPFRDAAVDTAWLDDPTRLAEQLPAPDPAPARELAAWALHLSERRTDGVFASDGFRAGGPAAPVVVQLDEAVTLTGDQPSPPVATITPDVVELVLHGQRFAFDRPDPARPHQAGAGDGTITAPMPGTVLGIEVNVGDEVVEGQVVAVIEAMKMELTLRAPFDGTVTAVDAGPGEQIALGALVAEVAPLSAAGSAESA